jgi:filamentous hemagglutinin family protein
MPRKLRTFKERFAKPLMAGVLLSSFFGATVASANPTGGTVRSGNVNITNVGPNTLHIEQMTQQAIIDWQRFGIGQGESVRFLQPNELSVILNRVVGQDPSQILGNLSANGNVFLINPNGILFGPNSVVNVGGLVASTLNISNEDFLNGNYRFTQDANKALASVVNQGTITITDGGYAVLMAPLVSNEGLIVANLGQVNLMSGESATLNFDGRNLISYDVGHMDSATPGTVVVDRETVSGLLANVIQDPTLTEAGSMIENEDGSVSLVGMGDTVLNNGTIQTNGADGEDAGKIVLESGRLTVVGSDAVVQASGEGQGSDGGEVIALSHGTMKLSEGATLEARAAEGGDGGFVDTSGKGRIILEEYADVGTDGIWLIDPEFLTIISGSGGTVDTLPVPPDTSGVPGQTSSISEDFLEGITAGKVILQADNQITINDLADNELTFMDGVDVCFDVTTGDLVFADRNDSVRVGGDADLDLQIGRDLYLGVVENEGSGTVSLNIGRDIYDGNGDGANIVGDHLTFDLANGDLSVVDELGTKTDPTALDIAGTAGAGSDPLSLTFNNVGTNDINILSGGPGGRDLDLSSGTLSSGNFQTRPTDVTFNDIGNVVVDGFQAENVDINSVGTINGNGNSPDLTAATADLNGTQIGNSTELVANVGNLDVDASVNNGVIDVDTGALTTDLTIRSTNSVVEIDDSTVTTANAVLPGFPVANPPGVTTNFTTLTFNDPTLNFSFLESANRTLEIGGVTAATVTLDTPGSIIDLSPQPLPTGDEIQADSITLNAGERIGTFAFDDGTGTMTNVPDAPITVNNTAGSGGAVDLSLNANRVNVVHAQDPATNFVEFNSDAQPPPVPFEADLLNVEDSAGDSFSSLSFTRTTGDIVVGQIGAASPLTDLSITALDGNILNSTVVFLPGDTNIFSETLSLVAFNGSVGTVGDPIETSVREISGQGTNGFFVANALELEVFSLITDGNSDAFIGGGNGELHYVQGTGLFTNGGGGGFIGDGDGDTNGDGFDVVVDVQFLGADIDIANAGVKVRGDNPPGGPGHLQNAQLNLTAQGGDIVTGGGTDITAAMGTDVNLIASGDVGTRLGQISVDSTNSNPAELRVDSGGDIGLDLQDDFAVVSLTHSSGDVLVDGGIITVDNAAPGLDIAGTPHVGTINYTDRTGNIPLGLIDAAPGAGNVGSDINITAVQGDITSNLADNTSDIVAGDQTVSVRAAGDFSAEATSTATGSLDLIQVGGNATVETNPGLNLDLNETAGTVAGNLIVDNDATLTIGDITVGGSADFTVGANSLVTNDDPFTPVDLVASSLNVTTDGSNSQVRLDTDVDSITFTEGAAAVNGLIIANNIDDIDSVTIDSRSSRALISTNNTGASFDLNGGGVLITTGAVDVGTVDITERNHDLVVASGDFSNPRMTDVTLTTDPTTTFDITGGVLRTEGNLTVRSADRIALTTNVAKTLDLEAGMSPGVTGSTITGADLRPGGPQEILINTNDGQLVDFHWGPGQASFAHYEVSGPEELTIGESGANTDVTFETGVGDILVDAASVGIDNTLTLIASDPSSPATAGRILDLQPDGNGGATDIIAQNANLLAIGDIGESTNCLETEIEDTLTARSDSGSVYLCELDTIEHLIVDVFDSDYIISFLEFGTGDTVTTQYLTGPTTGVMDGPGTGGANTLNVTNSGGGSTMSGTDLTFIERDTQTVELISSIDNTGDADPGTDGEFVRIISGGSIISNDRTNVISTQSVDLISNGVGGTIGTEPIPIFLAVNDICVDVRGVDTNAYVVNDQQIGNLFLAYNQDGGGGGDVNVVWQDNAGNDVGVNITDQLLSTQVNFTDGGGTNFVATDVDEANVVVSNGNFQLEGSFTQNGVGNGDTFERVSNSYEANSGGDIIVGEYTARDTNTLVDGTGTSVTTRLELTARGTDGGIFDDGNNTTDINLVSGAVDADGGQSVLTLVSQGTNIGGANPNGPQAGPIEMFSTAADTVQVNAYAENQGGEDTEGDIQITSAGGAVEYNEVYAGTNLELIAPFHEQDQFSPGGVDNFTPQQRAGSATLTGDGEVCVNDVRAGTSADESMGTNDGRGDVEIRSEGAGDILIGRVEAGGSTVRVVQTADGNVLEKAGTENDGNVFARNFEADLDGAGDIGTKGANKPENALDIVVLESSLDVDDGNVYLRNVGNIIYNDVNVERSGTDGEVYLVSEGVTVAGNVEVGNTTDVDLLIETRPGSDLLVGNVQAIGNTVTLRSTGDIRGDANMLNLDPLNQADTPFADQGRIQADNVLLLADGEIGSSATPMSLVASSPGGTVVVSADTSGTSGGGSTPFTPTTAGDNNGSVLLEAGPLTNLVVGTVVDDICNFSGTGIANAVDICIDVTDGTLQIAESINASDDVQLEASGDITLGDTTTTDFTQTTNDGTMITVSRDDGRINASSDTGIESTGGSIVDGNDGADNIRTGNILVLHANGSVGAASFDGNPANDDAIEVRAQRLAGRATTGSFNVDDQTGDLRIVNAGGGILKSGTGVGGVVAADDICIEAERDLRLENVVTSNNEGVALNARTRDLRFQNNGRVTGQDVVSLEAGRNIRDFNGGGLDADVQGTGQLVMDAGGGIGSDQNGNSEAILETDAGSLAARSTSGDINIDNASNLTVNVADTLKGGNTITGVSAGREVCIDNTGTLNINEDIVGGTSAASDGDIELRATGDITIGNDANDEVRTVDPFQTVSIESTGGSIIDNNGVGNAAVEAFGSEVGLRAVNGTIGSVDFSASPNSGQVFEIDARELAVESGNDVNIADLDTNGPAAPDGLVIGSVDRAKTGGTVDGVSATNDICIDVVNGNLVLLEDVENGPGAADGSGVALQTRDADNATDGVTDGDIVLQNGASVINSADNDVSQPAITSLEAAGQIRQIGAGSSVEGANVALESEEGIGHTNDDVAVVADVFAAGSTTSGDINLALAERTTNAGITVGTVGTLKGENTLVGVDAAEDVCLDSADDLQVNEDVISRDATDAGDSDIYIQADGDITVGDGTNNAEVRTANADQRVVLEATGNIVDNNTANNAAVEAVGGEVVLVGTNVGTVTLSPAAGTPATGTPFEIEAEDLAFDASGDVNVRDLDNLVDDGLDIETIAYTNKAGGTTTADGDGGDVCIEVENGDLDVNSRINATNIALATRNTDADADGDINLNGNAAPENVTATGNVSLESARGIADTNATFGEIEANGLVMTAVNGIGATGDIQTDVSSIAAETTTGDLNIDDGVLSNDNAGLTVAEDLFSLKGGVEVDGLTAPGEICLDVVGNLVVEADIVAGADVALEASGNITLGDALGAGSAETGVVVAGAGLDVNMAESSTVSIEAGGNVIDGNGQTTTDSTGDGIADGVNVVAHTTVGDGSAATRTGDLAVTTGGSFGDANFTNPAVPTGNAIEAEIGRVAAISGGDFNLEDVSGDLEIAEGLNTLKTPEATPFNGVTAGEDICIDASDTNGANLFVNADITADDLAAGTINNIALAANDNVILGDTAGAQAGVVRAGADAANGNNTGGAAPNGVVSVEARNGAILDGQQDDANMPRTRNIINRGGDTVLIGMLGVGDNAGPDQAVPVNPDPIPGVPPGDVSDLIEIDTTRFAAEATMGSVTVFDVDTDMDGLDIDDLNNLKDGRLITGVTSGLDVCIEVINQDIIVDDNIVAARNVALKTNQNVVLGDTSGPDRGVIVAGAGKDLIIGNGDDVVGNVSIEAGGSITDGNGDSRVDGDGDGFADGANIIATGDVASGGTTTGGFVVLSAGGGIGSDAAGANEDAIEIDALSVAAVAGTGDVNLTDQDIVTQDGLDIGSHITLKAPGVSVTGVTANDDACIDVEDGDLRINESITATTGDVALRTQQLLGNSGNGDIRFGDNTAGGGDAAVETVTAGTGSTVSVEAAGNAIDDNGTADAAIVAAGDSSVVFTADNVAGTTGAFQIEAATLSAEIDAMGTGNGDVLVDDLSGDLRIIERDTLKGGNTVTGVTATGDVCIDVALGSLEVDEDVTAGDDVALEAQVNVTLGDDGTDAGEGTGTGVVTAGNDGAETGVIAVQAVTGNVTDGNGDGAVSGANLVTDAGGGVSISAATGIGSVAGNNDVETDTTFFAANGGTGDVNVTETDAVTQDGLDIDAVTDGLKGISNTGVTADGEICIDVVDGDLNINEDITSATGNIALRTQQVSGNSGNGDIVVGDDPNAANEAAADTVITNGTDRLISVEADGDVVDNNGQGNVAFSSDGGTDGGVVIIADQVNATDDGNAADTDALEIRADILSGSAVGGANGGDFIVDDLTGDLRVETLTTLKGGVTPSFGDGINAVDDTCIEVIQGSLDVNDSLYGGDNVSLRAAQNVELGDAGGVFNGVVVAGTGDDLIFNTADDVLGTVSVEATNGNITDGNGAAVNVIAMGADGTTTGGNVVLVAGGGIGSDASGGNENEIEMDGFNLAASAGTGDVNVTDLDVEETDGLTISEITTGKNVTQTVTGITAGTDICIDVVDGDLNIDEDITSTAGDIALRTQQANGNSGNGDIVFGDDNAAVGAAADQVRALGTNRTVSVEAVGDIVDNNGANNSAITANGANSVVVLTGDDISAVNDTDAFEIEAGTLAAAIDVTGTGNGNIFVDDQSGSLRIVEADTLKGGTTVIGLTATGDVCIDVEVGSLEVDENVMAGDDVALEAQTNVVLGDDGVDNGEGTTTGVVTAGTDGAETGVIAVQAVNGNVTDGNGDAAVTGENLVTDAGGGVSISAGGNIGSVAGNNDIEIDTTLFAAGTGVGGDVNVTETDTVTQDGLDIDTVTDALKGINNSGVIAGGDVCIDVVDGDLNINEDIFSGAGDIALRTQQANGNSGNGDIRVGDNTAGGGDAFAESILALGTDRTVSLEADGDIIDDNGADNSAIVANGANSVVVLTGDDISAVNDTDPFELEAGALAANIDAAGTGNGNVLIDDQSGDLRIIEADTLKGGTTVTGVTATGDICIDVELGSLEVDEDVTAGDDIALEAENNVTLGDDGTDNGEGTGTGVVTAGNDGAETGVIAVQAVTGNVTDGNGDAAGTGENLVTDAGGGVSISAGAGIGLVAGGNSIETDTTFFAANAAGGDVNIVETDTVTQDGLDIDVVTDSLKGIDNTGVTATGAVCIDVVDGALDVNQSITGGTTVDLRTQDNAGNNTGDINVNAGAVVTAQAGDITVDASDDVVDNNGMGNAAFIASDNLVLDVGDELRSTEVAPDDQFEIEAVGFAASVGTGGVNVTDLTGDLEIVEGVTGKDGDTIDGVTAPGDVCLDVVAGSLDIGQQITSADGNVALQATGDITITGADDITADANGGAGTVSVEAGDEILDTGDGSFVGQDVVLESVNGIGTDNPVTIDATNLAADGGTGRANITDIAGGVTVTTLDTLKGGDTITGVTAAQDVCLQVIGGDLVIDEVVTAGTVAAIQADGSIASNATVTGTDKVSVQSGGDIVDGLGDTENFIGSQVVLSAEGDIGSKTDAIDIDSDEMAAQSVTGEVNLNETNGDMNVRTIDLEKNGGTVAGVSAGTDICLTADDGTLTYPGQALEAGNEIAVRVRDTLNTDGTMTTGPGGRISVEVTDGAIQDSNQAVDFETGDLVLKAQGSIGSDSDAIDTNVDRAALESETGDIYLFEEDGLKITELELAKGGGFIDGALAANDIDIEVDKGDLEIELVTAGNDVTLTATEGDIKDCNEGDLNIDAGGDVELNAPQGCVEDLEIEAGGAITYNDTKIRNFNPEPLVLPPGVFAQDNVKLGETSFYLDVLYGYLTPEQIDLILDELEAYDFWNDGDFLLEKHPDGERDDDDKDEEILD